MFKRKLSTILLYGLLVIVSFEVLAESVYAQDSWGFGTEIGFLSGTVDDTVFALGFNADYYLAREFSIGPMVQLAPAGDLFQIAFAGVARYHIPVGSINLVPLAGIGFVHASLDRGQGASRIDRNDTSFFIPLGLSAEFPVSRHLALASTLMVNLQDIKLDPPIEDDNVNVGLLFGVRFNP